MRTWLLRMDGWPARSMIALLLLLALVFLAPGAQARAMVDQGMKLEATPNDTDDMFIRPSPIVVGVGQEFDMVVVVEGSVTTAGAQLRYDFDPTYLEVLSLTKGQLPIQLYSNFGPGWFQFAAGQLGPAFTPPVTVVTVRLRALAATPGVTLIADTAYCKILGGDNTDVTGTCHDGLVTIIEPGAIRGVVYDDANGSGSRDAGEAGIPGVTISAMQDVDGDGTYETPAGTETTASDGSYEFASLIPGDYRVEETDLPDYVSTTPNIVDVTVVAGSEEVVDFGDRLQPGTVEGTVFDDVNGNHVQDPGEFGLFNVQVDLVRNGVVVDTTNTSPIGRYQFTSVAPTTYIVRETDPAGHVSTTPNDVTVVLTPGGTATANFGDQQAAQVGGTVFNDLNGNGAQDAGETGIPGVRVTLDGQETTTGPAGLYQFDRVAAGNHTVHADTPAGYTPTGPTDISVSVAPGDSVSDVDFGFRQEGTIAGTVFNDIDGDGVQGAGEAGLPNVSITLWNSAGAQVDATTTGPGGSYNFSGVVAGNYAVEETDPPGYASTTPNLVTVAVVGNGTARADFGDKLAGTISGFVFEDANGNGARDPGEPGIGGVEILLSNGEQHTTNTDGNGFYEFSGVAPGTYTVVEVADPAGYVSTTPNARLVTITGLPGGESGTANFGDQRVGIVSGVVFEDRNGDGRQDADEPGIPGVTITLSNGEQHTTTTDRDGRYEFSGVTPGDYAVTETDPDGYVSTTTNRRDISVPSGGGATANFGDQRVGTVSGVVFNDLNGNGSKEAGESGIANVTVRLVNGTTISTTTNANGVYQFSGVTPGNYRVVETDPDGYVSTTSNSRPVSVPSGGSATANFGDQQAGTVSGTVFEDLNGNGVQDAGESGIGGVTVELFTATKSTLRAQTTTTSDGRYRFVDVTPGNYTVVETDRDGYISTTPNHRPVSVAVGGSATANFGDQPAGTISGVVFNDLNGNGQQDAGEAGIGGVTVELRQNGVSTPTTTIANGFYVFSNVAAGAYVVVETDLSGYVSTTPNQRNVSIAVGGSATANFGDQRVGTVSGVVYEDIDGNGSKSGGENGIGGVQVELFDAGGARVAQATTTNDGRYGFANVTPGSYTVVETDPAGYASTTPNRVNVSVGAGAAATANFGDQLAGTVSGVVFNDTDGNRVRGGDEPGIGGVQVELRQGAAVVDTTTTAGDGTYRFVDVAPGAYTVVETDPPLHSSTTPNAVDVSIAVGGSATANFGDQGPGLVAGKVFEDLNGNGQPDLNEFGIGGVQVELLAAVATKDVLATTTTAGNGAYSFSDVAPGDYLVRITVPQGYVPMGPTETLVTVASAGSASASFGLQRAATFTGVVFDDLNGDYLMNAGEPGVGGVTVDLYQFANPTLCLLTGVCPPPQQVGSVVTAGDGSYSFGGLASGFYQARATAPSGYIVFNLGTVSFVPPGGSATANISLRRRATIRGIVFNDANGNGQQDGGEPGIGGVTVTLDPGGLSATTSGDGRYSFEDLTPGVTYVVEETDPAGFVSTTPNRRSVTLFGSGASASVNFGDQRTATVAGTVWEDRNGNGAQDAGEMGLNGIEVQLIQGASTVATTHTSGGNYRFADVAAGAYAVRVVNPTGFVNTTANPRSISVAPGGSASANFGLKRVGTVSGIVFNDANGNGRLDTGEQGIGGVAIEMTAADKSVVATTTTAGNGFYEFSNVTPGNYVVRETDPDGYISTTPNERMVSLAADGTAAASFGDQLAATVGGTVFDDANGNGRQDSGERGIDGVVVELVNGTTISTTTSGGGGFQFTGIVSGTYAVVETDPAGYVSTTPNSRRVTLGPGGSAVANFGDQQVGTIQGKVFNDLDGDGQQGLGELGIGGVTVELVIGAKQATTDRTKAVEIVAATTSGDGSYSFAGLAPGLYTVVETDPDGYVSTTRNAVAVSLGAGSSASVNFGDQQTGTISGAVFDDFNGDGIRQAGEPGLGGVQITLLDGDTASTTTAGDGLYQFIGVAPGPYTVQETDPAGYVSSSSNVVAISVPAGGGANANFADQRVGTVGGTVFEDLNGNRVRDPGETGLANVDVLLADAALVAKARQAGDPSLLAAQATDSALTGRDGSFEFTDVPPGYYAVVELDPDGYHSTTRNTFGLLIGSGGSASASFGDQPSGQVCGVVFSDSNGNGSQDSSESGIGGVTLTLDSSRTTTTNSAGSYCFDAVADGEHAVEETDPDGYTSTTPNEVAVAIVDGGSASANFGDQPLGTVSGVVFEDRDGDQVRGAGEPGIGGVIVELIGATGTATTTTNSDGTFDFLDVEAGNYTVQETDPAGYTSTTPNTVGVSVAVGGSASAQFGDIQTGSVGGAVFNDLNANGVQDGGEPGLGGVTVELITESLAASDKAVAPAASTTTNSDGSYRFGDVVPGTYTVAETDPAGFTSTTPNAVAVPLEGGGSASANFGDRPVGSISGVVFNDLNGNGVQERGEPGIGGVLVQLLDASGAVVDSTRTAGDGIYEFINVLPGRYAVRETDPPGFASTTSNYVLLTVSDSGDTVNFGDVRRGTVSGIVFNDRNANGRRDWGEPGLAGVRVRLFAGSTFVREVRTFGDGGFVFSGLLPGSYRVQELNPGGFSSTTPDNRWLFLPSGGSARVSFGDRASGRIYGWVYNDLNGSGRRDGSGERGLGGVLIILRDRWGRVVRTTRTNSSGYFVFHGLAAGTYYRVQEIDPAGFTSTTSNLVTVYLASGWSRSVYFGDAQRGTIRGQVVLRRWWRWWTWRPLRGVRVELWDGAHRSLLRVRYTDGSGRYTFSGLAAGNYWVHEVNPWRYWSMSSDWVPVRLAGGHSATVNFYDGYDPCVFGQVYEDLNLDGFLSDGEPTLSGVHVRLVDVATAAVVMEQDTGGDGSYLFQDAPLGTYRVEVEAPDGWVVVTENPVAIALVDKDQGETVNFGLAASGAGGTKQNSAETGTLRGQVQDINGEGIGGVEITVRDSQGVLITQTTTIANGSYSISGLPTGRLTVEASDAPGYVSVTANTRTVYLGADKGAAASFVDMPADDGITGFVFVDANGNGQREPGEVGLAGIEVRLEQGGLVISTTETTEIGAYSFGQVAGVYDVVAVDAADYVSTSANRVRSWGPAVIDFGDRFVGAEAVAATDKAARLQAAGAVAGVVFNDLDGNGTSEAGERPLGGVLVTLSPLAGGQVMTTTTTGDGVFIFRDLAAGAYEIGVAEAAGFVATTPVSTTVSLAVEGTSSISFGRRFITAAAGQGAVAGRVFNDLDGDGQFGANEPAMVGVTVRLRGANGDLVTTTAADGTYLFDGVEPGNYRPLLDVPAGFVPTNPRNLKVAVTAESLSSVSFGLLGEETVSGSAFFDLDGDGRRGEHERGVGGVTVHLQTSAGVPVTDTVTSVDGSFLFSGVADGDYKVLVDVPAGLAATTATEQLLASSETASFGLQPAGSVSGVVFYDLDGDDSLDSVELGLSGVTVSLSGTASMTTTTASNGVYQFLDLPAGDYTVTEADPDGYVSATNQANVNVPAGGAASANFGDRPTGTVSGFAFYDLDEDGTQGAGEPGFGGVQVQLLDDASKAVVATAWAQASGAYLFDGVVAGTYTVTVTPPADFWTTTPQSVEVTLGAQDSQAASFGLLGEQVIPEACSPDANSDGRVDIRDIMMRASDPACQQYIGPVASYWNQPWPQAAAPFMSPLRLK